MWCSPNIRTYQAWRLSRTSRPRINTLWRSNIVVTQNVQSITRWLTLLSYWTRWERRFLYWTMDQKRASSAHRTLFEPRTRSAMTNLECSLRMRISKKHYLSMMIRQISLFGECWRSANMLATHASGELSIYRVLLSWWCQMEAIWEILPAIMSVVVLLISLPRYILIEPLGTSWQPPRSIIGDLSHLQRHR